MGKETIHKAISIALVVFMLLWVFNALENILWAVGAIGATILGILNLLLHPSTNADPAVTRPAKFKIALIDAALAGLTVLWFVITRNQMAKMEFYFYWFQWSMIALIAMGLALVNLILGFQLFLGAPVPAAQPKRFCSKCGKPVAESADFCDKCGAPLPK